MPQSFSFDYIYGGLTPLFDPCQPAAPLSCHSLNSMGTLPERAELRHASRTCWVSRLMRGQAESRRPESTNCENAANMADSCDPGALLLGSSMVRG